MNFDIILGIIAIVVGAIPRPYPYKRYECMNLILIVGGLIVLCAGIFQ